ncbi:hypothetical protein A4X13_0g4737 [Tilletia indica]|uniref:Uncharacterized protein n=1 Tax=Tilletia indica TaxID=43049 RepID=A0A177TPN8_9BASI|nr:hypothetical protein A4X13_0g4737 [Tilletia indica]
MSTLPVAAAAPAPTVSTGPASFVTEQQFIDAVQLWHNTGVWDYNPPPTATQMCSRALDPQVADLVVAGYRAVMAHNRAGTRPTWEEIKIKYLDTAHPDAQRVVMGAFMGFFEEAELDGIISSSGDRTATRTVAHARPTNTVLASANAATPCDSPTTPGQSTNSSDTSAAHSSTSTFTTTGSELSRTSLNPFSTPSSGFSPSTSSPGEVYTQSTFSPLALSSTSKHNTGRVVARHRQGTSPRKKPYPDGKTGVHGSASPLLPTLPSPSRTSSSSSSNASIAVTPFATSSSSALMTSTPPHSLGTSASPSAAMSRPARKALAAMRAGQSVHWLYLGVVRWVDGATDGVPLTGAEVIAEAQRAALSPSPSKASPSKSETQDDETDSRAARLAHLRESWSCQHCLTSQTRTIRYELIGRTSNLSKHLRLSHPNKHE